MFELAAIVGRLTAATASLDPPLAAVDLAAFDANADDLLRRADGRPIRVASKSVRCRALLERVLARPGFAGILAYSLPEALWLAGGDPVSDDIVVGYPSVDRSALRVLASDAELAARVTLMIDSTDQLDLIDAIAPPAGRPELRVCLELDASYRLFGGRVHLGVRRSPLLTAVQTADLARAVVARPGFRLVGLMAYEAQVAGVGDSPLSRSRGVAVRRMQAASVRQLRRRRRRTVAAIGEITPIQFVNGGGTGSLERTAAESAVTELAAGSGLYGPTLFDRYRSFHPHPAALFALPVVRRPAPGVVTAFSGGWPASGPPGLDRVPRPVWPEGLRLVPTESAGEVQTPLTGAAADNLRVGDRVWFRHAKAGELCERVSELHLVAPDGTRTAVPTYRGEGQAFG